MVSLFKYLLIILLIAPVWIEKRTYNHKSIPKVYGPANKVGALYVENGVSIHLVNFVRQGSWVNISGTAGLYTRFLWEENGKIEVFNTQNVEGLFLDVDMSVFSGTCNLSSTDGLWFLTGDGIEDQTMKFRGSFENINKALENVQYNAPTQDPTNKAITGCLSIKIDKYENQPPTIIMENQ